MRVIVMYSTCILHAQVMYHNAFVSSESCVCLKSCIQCFMFKAASDALLLFSFS